MACTASRFIGHQFATISIVLLSIVLFTPGHALPRPAPMVGALSAPTQLLLSELLAPAAGAEDNVYYSEQLVSITAAFLDGICLTCCLHNTQKYPQQQEAHQQQQQQLLHHNMAGQAKHVSSSFVNKWPSLRDLLLTADYDDESTLPFAAEESVERERAQLESRLLARLHQLSEPAISANDANDDIMTSMPAKKQSEGVRLNAPSKQHNIKKNVQCKHRKNLRSN